MSPIGDLQCPCGNVHRFASEETGWPAVRLKDFVHWVELEGAALTRGLDRNNGEEMKLYRLGRELWECPKCRRVLLQSGWGLEHDYEVMAPEGQLWHKGVW